MKKLLLLISILFLNYLSFSQDIPKCKGYVSDYENIFTSEQNNHITKILSDYEKQTSVEIFILTISDYDDIFTLAQETFNEWGIGKKGVDNGLLIVVSKNKKMMRTHTGYGLDGYLPDGWLKHTGDSIGIKYAGEYYEGLLTYIDQIKTRIGSEYSKDNNEELIKENKSNKEQSTIEWLIEKVPWYVWVGFLIVWFIVFLINPEAALWILYFLFALGSKGSGGRSGGSGGSSGGGGSNSSWK